jgi:hypothetical protein
MSVKTTVQIRGEDKTAAAFRSVNSRAQNLQKSFSGLSSSVAGLATSFGALVGVGALGSFTKDLVSLGDRLQKVSIQTGIAVEELEILQFAASQAGVGTDQLNAAVQKFSINVGKAEDGTKLQADAFESLGVSIKDASGNLKGQSTLFVEVADAIASVEEPAVKARLASDLFGRTGVELLALLNLGAEGISNYGETLREAGGIVGKAASDEFSAFNDQLDLLSRSLRGKFAPILVGILPALTALAENLDHIAKFAGIAATAFVAAKIPALLAAITGGVTALTVAIGANPLGALAIGVTALGTAAFSYKDEIAEFFGFAEEPEKIEKTNTKLEDTAKILKDVSKAEKIRTKTAESFAQTTKKDVVPNLGKLEKALKKTDIQFKSIRGQEGLGGLTQAFVEFFGNLMTLAIDFLPATETIVKNSLNSIQSLFRETLIGMENQIVFQRNDISNAFADILNDFRKELEETSIEVQNIKIDVPPSAFDFTNTFAVVPGEIFDFSAVKRSAGKIDSLVRQIEGLAVVNQKMTQPTYRSFGAVVRGGQKYFTSILDGNENVYSGADLIQTSGGASMSRSSRSTFQSGSTSLANSGDGQVVVNIYDGTGRKLSEYDSAIRVEIQNRADRYNQFPALSAA